MPPGFLLWLIGRGVAWLHLLLDKHCGRKLHSLPAFLDACAQKQGSQVLLHGPRADVQMAGDLFVTAPLYEQVQYLLITRGNLDLVEVDHGLFVGSFSSLYRSQPILPVATLSPNLRL